MIGHGRILITTRTARVSHLLRRRGAVAPFGVHLQVAAVLLKSGTRERGIRENSPDLGAAEKVLPKLASPFNVSAAVTPCDRLFDRGRLASIQNLADDSSGAGPNTSDSR